MKLRESPEPAIRPTKAVVRKSIFERLEPWRDRIVCDLYAGIGSLGIEALSRGAAHVTFVDSNSRAIDMISANLDRLSPAGEYEVLKTDAQSFLAGSRRQFDVVLADPPYGDVSWEELEPQVDGVLAPAGCFVMELPKNAPTPGGIDTRMWGKSKVCLQRKVL